MLRNPRDTLELNREAANALAQRAGQKELQKILEAADSELSKRLIQVQPGAEGGFGDRQMQATRFMIRALLEPITRGLKDIVLGSGMQAAEMAGEDTIGYLEAADRQFRGVGTQPLALDKALMMSRAMRGTESSILHRLLGDPKHKDEKKRKGILERYGDATVQHFEGILQKGVITRKPWAEMRDEVRQSSPFLKAAPSSWAERIVRTETMNASGASSFEAVRAFEEDNSDDVLKAISSTFDKRTSADSYAVHGQIRRPTEAFESWFGLYQHPPDRPNDRSVTVPHMKRWKLPPYLIPKTDAEIARRWKEEGRKAAVPKRPRMTTVKLQGYPFEP